MGRIKNRTEEHQKRKQYKVRKIFSITQLYLLAVLWRGGMRNYNKYLGILFIFFALIGFKEYSYQEAKSFCGATFEYQWAFLVQIIGWLFLGLFLGGLNFINEVKKEGNWKANKEKLLILGIPSFLVLLLHGIALFGVTLPQPIVLLLLYTLTTSLVKYFAILLGYVAVSSFTKEKEYVNESR